MFRHATGKEPTAVFFIRSTSVDAFLMNAQGSIAYTTHAELSYQKELDVERYRKTMLAALMDTAMRLSTEGIVPLTASEGFRGLAAVHVILSAPWHQPIIETIDVSQDSPFEVSERAVRKAAEERITQTSTKLASELGGDLVIVGKKLSRFWINGYPTQAPYGKTAHTLQVQVVCAAIGTDIRNSIHEVLEKVLALGAGEVQLATSTAQLARLLPALDDEGRFVIIEPHGEVTEITLVEEGGIMGRTTINAGTHSLIRSIQKLTRLGPAEAETAIIMHDSRQSDPREKEALTEATEAWSRAVASALNVLSTNAPAPHVFAVAADTRWLSWFQSVLEQSSAIASEIGIRPKIIAAADALANVTPAHAAKHADYAAILARSTVDSAHSAQF
jgi:hypothetical protein